MMQLAQPRIEVSISSQRLSLWDGERLVRSWPVSTSKYGIGFKEGSLKTPVGGVVVKEKHGDGAEEGTIFKSRQPVGVWRPGMDVEEDLVLTRILRLDGIEGRNANTFDRYVYIHGTNGEDRIGRPASHGCVRLRNREMVELFEMVPVGTRVWIEV
jgi:lipoprotein-anchoring transpeptidase ErfK/SrfK